MLPDEATAGAQAIFATYGGREVGLIARTVNELLPNRRALATFFAALQVAVQTQQSHLLPTVRAVIDALEADPVARVYQAALATKSLPQAELMTYLIRLGEKQHLHSGVVNSITQQMRLRNDIATLDTLETQLRAQSNATLRYIGFQMLIVVAGSVLVGRTKCTNGCKPIAPTLICWSHPPPNFIFHPGEYARNGILHNHSFTFCE